MILPQPAGLSWPEWSQRVYGDLVDALGTIIPLPGAEESWQDWAEQIVSDPELDEIPSPEVFSTWQEWGDRMVEAMEVEA